MSTIAIIGYRGAGKTTISEWLAEYLQKPCIDTDERVLHHLGMTTVQEVWDELSEARWREVEAQIIPALLQEDAVVSLGGGAPMSDSVQDALITVPMVINCIADEETTLARIAKGGDRPMLHADDLEVRKERLGTYASLETVELDTNGDFDSVIMKLKCLIDTADSLTP